MPSAARLALLAPLFAITPAAADEECVSVKVDLVPTDSLQMVVWLEKADGTFVDTLYITAKTGLYGLGNRPGRMDFNSGPIPNPLTGVDDMWPYGRRVNTFPVWAHRHGMSWPEVVFQDGFEDNLSHSVNLSSVEGTPPYCRPISNDNDQQCWPGTADKVIWDTGTCATVVHTDKGRLSPTKISLYPPRADLTVQSEDSADVAMFPMLNPFDAITRATPAGGDQVAINWPVPRDVLAGDYVMYVEAAKAFDFNGTYNETVYPGPNVSYKACGLPYRGQPSVVYRVPFTISGQHDVQLATDYVGYGEVNGASGTLFPPDATITADTPGSGALRLQLVSDGSAMFRLRVQNLPQIDYAPPGTPSDLEAMNVKSTSATLRFIEPGDDGLVGPVTSYEVRVRANEPVTEENFAGSMPVLATIKPVSPGELALVEIKGLLPETTYYVGVRAFDDCYKGSPLVTARFTTSERVVGSVDACFVATAAYGSMMANDVSVLRAFRDSMLSRSILGELAVEAYYTFGPAMAGVIGESDVLRATARVALTPVIERVRKLDF
jgi:hypothetical protein